MRTLMEGRRIKGPIRGEATVLAINAPTSQARSYQMLAELRVQPPEGEPYALDEVSLYMRGEQWPLPGTSLPVMIDPKDPRRVRVDWDQVPARDRRQIQREVDAALDEGRIAGRELAGHADATPELRDLFSTSGTRTAPYMVELAAR